MVLLEPLLVQRLRPCQLLLWCLPPPQLRPQVVDAVVQLCEQSVLLLYLLEQLLYLVDDCVGADIVHALPQRAQGFFVAVLPLIVSAG